MSSRLMILTLALILSIGSIIMAPPTVEAHQPFCEFADLTFEAPWHIKDATISVAVYANMYPAADVDYYTFEAEAGQSIYLQMTIPSIDGQDERYAPMMAVFGPGLDGDPANLPDYVSSPADQGTLIVPMIDEPEEFYEPFGRRYYWNWQDINLAVPETGTYTVAVWHPEALIGRYVFVIGQKEVLGGQVDCFADMNNYFTPLVEGENPYRDGIPMDTDHNHADGETEQHGHDTMIDLSGSDSIPTVDLQVFSLGTSDYNLRIQTLNFEFAPQNVNGDHIPGQGHAHLYIDDVKVTRIYGEWYYLETVPEGAQAISVVLFSNDHRALVTDGAPIKATVMLNDVEMNMDGNQDEHAHQ
jgi:hypothetical protein